MEKAAAQTRGSAVPRMDRAKARNAGQEVIPAVKCKEGPLKKLARIQNAQA